MAIVPPGNKQIGTFQITGVVDEGDAVALIATGFYALVQKFDIRRESVIHSLYYGKNNPPCDRIFDGVLNERVNR